MSTVRRRQDTLAAGVRSAKYGDKAHRFFALPRATKASSCTFTTRASTDVEEVTIGASRPPANEVAQLPPVSGSVPPSELSWISPAY